MAKETKIAEIKLFDKWSFEGVMVVDQGLQGYLNIEPIVVPRTNGYYHNSAFYKTKINIVERLMNRFQVSGHKGKKHKISSGHNTGKAKSQANIMIEVLEALERKTKTNPIQVLVTAIENAAPREEVITIERSGARYAQAVDIGPQGAAHKAFDAQVSFVDCLVAEIMAAYNIENSGMAMTRRSEIEKMAAAAK
jgi:small subunit ribosomal protein S7